MLKLSQQRTYESFVMRRQRYKNDNNVPLSQLNEFIA